MAQLKETKIANTIVLSTGRRAAPGSPFDQGAAENALRFHRSLPMYESTKLVSLRTAAEEMGVKAIYLKDESTRFGLKAFKGLGGSYAVFRILCDKLGLDHRTAVFSDFTTEENRRRCGEVVFVTATDGNHGKGVAWASRLFGCRAHVYMPAGSVEARRKAIEDAGAEEVVISDLNYDKVVRFASRQAEEKGWTLIQDTSWEGYERIPQWIVEGYLTMGAEILEQLDGEVPTHVFLQAGVGAMSGGILGYLSNVWAADEPVFTIVEPLAVACLYESAKAGDGSIRSISGDPVTIMAGLNCGTPCSITWPTIRDRAGFYCACTDEVAENAMRELARFQTKEERVVAGECGAVTYGALREIIKNESLAREMGIDEDSVVLLISTEGDTDPAGYNRVVNNTIDYYNLNAADYYESTIGVDFDRMRSRFASYLPEHARIIDVGCGSGRDVKAFCEMGFQAAGLDASEALARMTAGRLGIQVFAEDMTSWISQEPYDGIWCCASLLHLSEEGAEQFLHNLRYNLRPGGILYVSVKEGIQTGPDEKGRYFRNYTQEELTDKLQAAGLTVLAVEVSGDLLGRDQFRWLNVFARRE